MHTIYHTKAVILRSEPIGEANKRYWLFTEDLGLVVATAQGVRKAHSKLAPQLVDYSFVDVDLVKGRDIWRLVNAGVSSVPFSNIIRNPLTRSYVRTLTAIDRFVSGEGIEHRELFTHIATCANSLANENIDSQKFDALSIWRSLSHLGYIAVPIDETELFEGSFDDVLSKLDTKTTKTMIKQVNDAISHTHL